MPPLAPLDRPDGLPELDAPAVRRRMLVVVNPYATAVSGRLRNLVLHALDGRYDVDAVDTAGRDHATALARLAADDGYDVVAVLGGDGTVNEAANGLSGSPTALTCLPGGATNVYHRMLGIPDDLIDATQHLLRLADRWRPRRLDLGHVNGRCFLFSSGYGLDAAVVKQVDAHPRAKARLRHWYYAYAGVTTFARDYLLRPPRIDVEAHGATVRGVSAFVQNGDPYTYWSGRPLRVAEGAALDDGALAGAVLRRASPVDAPTIVARLFARRLRIVRHRRVTGLERTAEVRCTSADGRAVPLQVDGDYIGDAVEAHYGIAPGALTVVS